MVVFDVNKYNARCHSASRRAEQVEKFKMQKKNTVNYFAADNINVQINSISSSSYSSSFLRKGRAGAIRNITESEKELAPRYEAKNRTWNEACFGKGKAQRKSCDGKNIHLHCGCQQRVSQTWCSTRCGGMYQFPMDTPGSASMTFVTFT